MAGAPPHEGEYAAQQARAALGLPENEPIADLIRLIEGQAGVPVFLAPLPGDIAGLAQRQDGRWYILGDSSDFAGRLRFTLAHEFGHVCMNHRPAVDDDSTLSAFGVSSHPDEVAANYFAAELLMPRAMVMDAHLAAGQPADCMDLIVSLATRAGTSKWVPLYRLNAVGLLTATERREHGERLQSATVPEFLSDEVARYARTGTTRMPGDHAGRARAVARLIDQTQGA